METKGKFRKKFIKINKVLQHVKITGFTHCRNVIQAAMKIVGEEVGMKKSNAKKKKEPFWKRRILTDISRLRKDLSRIEAWFAGRWKKDKKKEKDWLDQKYGLRRKGFTLVMEELKQRIIAKATKVKRCNNRIKQFQDNRKSETNQVRFFKNLKLKRRGQNHRMLKTQQHFGKEYGVQKSSISKMPNGLTKQKRRCHLKNRMQ